jgi:hypothetical protein
VRCWLIRHGYGGVEFTLPTSDKYKHFRELLERYNLAFIAQIVTRDDHISSFESLARQAAEFNPVKIVSHRAKDSMSIEDQLRFFAKALAVEEAISIPIAHETHKLDLNSHVASSSVWIFAYGGRFFCALEYIEEELGVRYYTYRLFFALAGEFLFECI